MIGLCTPYKINNYGTKLQAYAVQEKIKELGYDCEIINFDRKSDMRINKLFSRYVNINYISSKLKTNKKNGDINYLKIKNDIKTRNDAINSFDSTHYCLSVPIKGYRNLNQLSKKYDALICGSDQIWLPTSIDNPTAVLDFGGKGIRRIAFAPSFGISNLPKNKINKYKRFLRKIDFISVREQQGQKIIKDILNVDVSVVLDPTLTVKKKIWDELLISSQRKIHEKYVFCYFLGSNEEHRKKVYDFAKDNNYKVVSLAHFKAYNECDEKYTDIKLYDVTPCDFIKLIVDSEYVFTDSFHSTVFSIIYHKKFFTFERFINSDKKSANSRIYSLLDLLGIDNRLISNNIEISSNNIDYDAVDKKLEKLRIETDKYLNVALDGIRKDKQTNQGFFELSKEFCSGCGACSSICPKKCIEMQVDEKTGFKYPKKNLNDCIDCNLCNRVCPNKQKRNYSHSIGNAYFAINKNKEELLQSSSGGLFTAFSRHLLEENGYVCGAAFNENFDVHHIIVDNEKDLVKLMGSKYSESDLGDIFSKIKKLLDSGKKVLFSGTPCQVHGLKNYLLKEYDNLYTIDLLCYGIQSPKAWKLYKSGFNKKIVDVNMRDKNISWQNYSMKIRFNDNTEYLCDKNNDPYLKSYSKGLFIRPSCYNCSLKAFPRKSDITIGDFWDIDKIIPERNNGEGASILFVNSQKGQELLGSVEDNLILELIDNENLKKVHPLFCLNAKKSNKSSKFFEMLNKDNVKFSYIVKKCYDRDLKVILKKIRNKIRG